MEQKRYGGALALISVVFAIALFSIWPPQKASSKTAKYVNNIDSMNNIIRVEVDLYQYRKLSYEKITTVTDTAYSE